MKVIITLDNGVNRFEADGEFTFDAAFQHTLGMWMNAQQPGSDADTIASLTEDLKQANDAHEATIAANTPKVEGA